jgi:hypothetical protein
MKIRIIKLWQFPVNMHFPMSLVSHIDEDPDMVNALNLVKASKSSFLGL